MNSDTIGRTQLLQPYDMTSRFDRIDVIVPVLNEEETVRTFYERIARVPLPLHFIFVDNASTDRTRDIVRTFPDSTLM